MPWWYAVIESRHELQNPTSPEKIRLLGRYLELGPRSRVLELAAGRGGPSALADPRQLAAREPDDPDADEFRERGRHYRERYLRWRRGLLAWAIFVGRKP